MRWFGWLRRRPKKEAHPVEKAVTGPSGESYSLTGAGYGPKRLRGIPRKPSPAPRIEARPVTRSLDDPDPLPFVPVFIRVDRGCEVPFEPGGGTFGGAGASQQWDTGTQESKADPEPESAPEPESSPDSQSEP